MPGAPSKSQNLDSLCYGCSSRPPQLPASLRGRFLGHGPITTIAAAVILLCTASSLVVVAILGTALWDNSGKLSVFATVAVEGAHSRADVDMWRRMQQDSSAGGGSLSQRERAMTISAEAGTVPQPPDFEIRQERGRQPPAKRGGKARQEETHKANTKKPQKVEVAKEAAGLKSDNRGGSPSKPQEQQQQQQKKDEKKKESKQLPQKQPLKLPEKLPQKVPQKVPQKLVDPMSNDWTNTIAICALMKDEEVEDVMEWLQYHRWLGVDRIFLRENGANVSDNFAHALDGMVQDRFLNFGSWEGQSPRAQQEWYNKCSEKHLGGGFSWILFIDLDEYLVHLKDGLAAEDPNVKGYLTNHRDAAGLTLQWVLFGSGGHRHRPQGGPLRWFTKCMGILSFQMKCLAASHHLSKHPIIAPKKLHQCCYKYDKEQPESEWKRVRYGNGEPALDHKVTDMYLLPKNATSDHRPTEHRTAKCRTYEGHLQPHEYPHRKALPAGDSLVLFHYVTRSFDDFRVHKVNRYAGAYASEFREAQEQALAEGGKVPSDEELFDDLEKRMGLDTVAPVCRSAAYAQYDRKCCARRPCLQDSISVSSAKHVDEVC